jgi:uncharacterized OsmC-like protein
MYASNPRPPIVVTHDGGSRFSADIRGHRIMLDQPIGAGGDDAGPMPIELLGAALASCVALYVHKFLEVRGVAGAGLRVEVDQHSVRNPNRIGDFGIRVVTDRELPPAYGELLERVATSCPVHNTLVQGAQIGVTIEVAKSAAVVNSGYGEDFNLRPPSLRKIPRIE